jgi:hypothetical protein
LCREADALTAVNCLSYVFIDGRDLREEAQASQSLECAGLEEVADPVAQARHRDGIILPENLTRLTTCLAAVGDKQARDGFKRHDQSNLSSRVIRNKSANPSAIFQQFVLLRAIRRGPC